MTARLVPWLPSEQLPFLCRHIYLATPEDSSLFFTCLVSGLRSVSARMRQPKCWEHLELPRHSEVYGWSMVGHRKLISISTATFIMALISLGRTWTPRVLSMKEIPLAIISAILRQHQYVGSSFPNIRENEAVVRQHHWMDTVVLRNLLVLSNSPEDYPDWMDDPNEYRHLPPSATAAAAFQAPDLERLTRIEAANSGVHTKARRSACSVMTDLVERLVDPAVLKRLMPNEGVLIQTPSRAVVDSYAISAAVLCVICWSHTLLSEYLGPLQLSSFYTPAHCRLGCCSITESFDDVAEFVLPGRQRAALRTNQRPAWTKSVSRSHLTVGIPSVESLYKRVVDLLNGVSRVIQSSPSRSHKIPSTADANFDPQCECCKLCKNIYNLVVLWSRGQVHEVEHTDFVFNTLSDAMPPSRSNAALLTSAFVGLPQQRATFRIGASFLQALEQFKDVRTLVEHKWVLRMESRQWSSQRLSLVMGMKHDDLLLGRKNTGPAVGTPSPRPRPSNHVSPDPGIRFDLDDSILRTTSTPSPVRSPANSSSTPASPSTTPTQWSRLSHSQEGFSNRLPSPPRTELADMTTLDSTARAFVLPVARLLDVRFTISIVNSLFEEYGIKADTPHYTLTRRGAHVVFLVPGPTYRLLSEGLMPLLGSFRYAKAMSVLPDTHAIDDTPLRAHWGSSSLQVLRNFYQNDPVLLNLSMRWIDRMLLNRAADAKTDCFMEPSDASFEHYRLLPNLIALLSEEEILVGLREPYQRADYWAQRVHLRARLRKKKKKPVDPDTPEIDDLEGGYSPRDEDGEGFVPDPPLSPEESHEGTKPEDPSEVTIPSLTTTTTRLNRNTIYFSGSKPSFLTSVRAFLRRRKAHVLLSFDAMRAVWFTLVRSPFLWRKYAVLAAFICETRVPPQLDPRGLSDFKLPLWIDWIESRRQASKHCWGVEHKELVCPECLALWNPDFHLRTDAEIQAMDPDLTPPMPDVISNGVSIDLRYLSEDTYYTLYEHLEVVPAPYRTRPTQHCIPAGCVLIPTRSRVFLGCESDALIDLLYIFASDPAISPSIRKRVFLGMNSINMKRLIQPSKRPKDSDATRFLTASLRVRDATLLQAKTDPRLSTNVMMRRTDDEDWIRAFVLQTIGADAGRPPRPHAPSSGVQPMPPHIPAGRSFRAHEQYNNTATGRFVYFMTLIEAQFYLDYDIPGDKHHPLADTPLTPTGKPVDNSYYGTLRKRHQLTYECIEGFLQPERYAYLRNPTIPVPCGFRVVETIYTAPGKVAEPTQRPPRREYQKCDYASCIPLWNSPLSDDVNNPGPVDDLYQGEFLPFRGCHESFVPLVTAYQISALGDQLL